MSDCVNGDSTTIVGTLEVSEKFCPMQKMHLTTDSTSTTLIGMRCIRELCQLWQSNNYDTSSRRDDLNQITGNPNPYLDEDLINDESGQCGLKTSSYAELNFRLNHHQHRQHAHTIMHKVDKVAKHTKDRSFGVSVEAGQLVTEFVGGEDNNSDGKVYGIDFCIDDRIATDPLPNMLTTLHGDPNFRKPYHRVPWGYYNDVSGPFYPAQVNSINANDLPTGGGSDYAWIKLVGGFYVDDTSYSDTHMNSFKVAYEEADPGFNYFIKDEKTLYVYLLLDGSNGYKDLYINNNGDTFDTGNYTAASRVFSNALHFDSTNVLDDDLQTQLRTEISDAGGNLVVLETI